jgi:hypothetical protein
MFRHIAILMVGAAAIANLNAGSVQLQIGGANGLTAGTVTQSVTGGVTGTVGENAYVGNIPPGSTVLTRTSGVPATGYPNGETSGQLDTVNDNGTNVTFAMINDSANNTANMWLSTNTAGSVTTPVVTTDTILMGGLGVFGVSNVWTMLNDQYGNLAYNGGQNTQVTFNFTTATGGFVAPLTFTLVNGVEISDAVDCTAGSGLSACQAFGYQTSLDTTNDYSPTGATNPSSGPDVSAFNVWSGTYNQGGGNYTNTTGSVFLDGQNFSLGSGYTNDYLTSIQVIDTQTGSRQSRDILSAITVEANAPEPSTWLLFAIGFGLFGFAKLRRKSTC